MKNFTFCLIIIAFFSCGSNQPVNNCFNLTSFNQTINLTNAEFINLQVPGGSAMTNLAGRDILIIRRTSTQYKAFDLKCPEGSCNLPMVFDGLILSCTCDTKRYSTLNGCPINQAGACIDDGSCFVLEYHVFQSSSNTLQISR